MYSCSFSEMRLQDAASMTCKICCKEERSVSSVLNTFIGEISDQHYIYVCACKGTYVVHVDSGPESSITLSYSANLNICT